AAQIGILFRGGDVVEIASKVDTILFDKTGTITKGKLYIVNISPLTGTEETVLKLAATAEYGATHPIAKAINEYAAFMEIESAEPNQIRNVAGRGVVASTNNGEITIGTKEFMEIENIRTSELKQDSSTLVYVAENKTLVGIISLADEIKDDADETISLLHENHLKTVMITGDNTRVAEKIARQAGIVDFVANVLPEQKAQQVEKWRKKGKIVAFVGDGVNDAPALATADVGISAFGGTDVAADSSGIILMRDDTQSIAQSILLSKKIMRIIKQNLFWAFIYNIIGIPIAAGVWFAFGGPTLTPMFAGLAMAFSSVCVVLNSLRLSAYNRKKSV
ncbi:MAG: HAD-IC family P-type ATPase, partial [Christensenellaceae bacterium]